MSNSDYIDSIDSSGQQASRRIISDQAGMRTFQAISSAQQITRRWQQGIGGLGSPAKCVKCGLVFEEEERDSGEIHNFLCSWRLMGPLGIKYLSAKTKARADYNYMASLNVSKFLERFAKVLGKLDDKAVLVHSFIKETADVFKDLDPKYWQDLPKDVAEALVALAKVANAGKEVVQEMSGDQEEQDDADKEEGGK